MSQILAKSVTFDILEVTQTQDTKRHFVPGAYAAASVGGEIAFDFDLSLVDSDAIAEIIVAAARRKLAEVSTP